MRSLASSDNDTSRALLVENDGENQRGNDTGDDASKDVAKDESVNLPSSGECVHLFGIRRRVATQDPAQVEPRIISRSFLTRQALQESEALSHCNNQHRPGFFVLPDTNNSRAHKVLAHSKWE